MNEKQLTGTDAANAMFQNLKGESEKEVGGVLSFNKIGPVIMFKWLLGTEEGKFLDDLAKNIWRSVGEAAADSKGPPKKCAKLMQKTLLVDSFFLAKPTKSSGSKASSSTGK